MTRRPRTRASGTTPKTQEILAARTVAFAARGGAVENKRILTVLACEAGGSLYGLPLLEVARVELASPQGVAPGDHPAFLGLTTVAGQVRSVLDFAGLVSSTVSPEPGGYLLVPRNDMHPALRIVQRPSAVEVEPLEEDAGRAIVRSDDERKGRVLSLLSLRELFATLTSPTSQGV